MNKRLLMAAQMLLCFTSLALGGMQVNLHQKDGGVVSYSFEDKPVVSYQGDYLHVATAKISVDYPLSELEKMTFEENASAVDELRTESPAAVLIYTLEGRLLRMVEASEGVSCANLSDLPAGTYVIKNGTKNYKIIKR